ncbi:hypothetical protein LX15_005830 [Streptoalloteichus tenebrarius]|uniref:Uncharacterized protein n=1 Tax=Streptoalloteichus tenebrarius (strain ATCC 17920 / DSM 40477 / JCM 4838 / CBS 697.72 / NBRC 16177 / NCIMB 11028 / NRRL B-12390 / A12253. 1 / ISP 5477) TaxID=1933 RepID=A0ABT1I2S7_STRSD|nr:hypothetical protein [Streptoalloteichus tenebrarius]MCP2262098.1 hypothetical protein [Streptoalloteichus tenebrarius]BFF02252.1 hypothetical protein GCM10020241_39270 [Streptoalloteichus tenebrarius]
MGEFGPGRNWLAVPHQQIYDDIHSGPGERGAEGAHRRCAAVAAAFAKAERDIAAGLRRLGIAFEGVGAQAALGAAGGLAAWTADARLGAVIAMDLVSEQIDAFTRARDAMPVPSPAGDQEDVVEEIAGVFDNTADREPVEEAAREAHERAARLMRDYEAESRRVVGAVPVFVPPPDVVVDVPGAGLAPRPRRAPAPGGDDDERRRRRECAHERMVAGDRGRRISDHRTGPPRPLGPLGAGGRRPSP